MPVSSPSSRCAPTLALVAAVVSVLLLALPAAAQVRNLFEVTGVRVDETADNAEAARERALAVGERRAFEILLERITAPEDRARLGSPPRSAIEPLIKDFWISEEKASRVRYIAVLNYNFRPQPVREFLRRHGIAFSTQPAPPAVVVPLLRTPDGPRLWEEDNPWRAAWAGEGGTALRPLRTPGAGEAPWFGADQALALDVPALGQLAQQFQAAEAIVAAAEVVAPASPEQPAELLITLNRREADGRAATTSITVRGRAGEDVPALLKRGAREVALTLDAAWKGQTRTTPRPTQFAAVDVPVDDLRTWLEVQRRLAGIDAIEAVHPVLFSRKRVRINVAYATSPEDLVAVLKNAGLVLTLGEDAWTLRLGEGVAARGPATSGGADGQ